MENGLENGWMEVVNLFFIQDSNTPEPLLHVLHGNVHYVTWPSQADLAPSIQSYLGNHIYRSTSIATVLLDILNMSLPQDQMAQSAVEMQKRKKK